MGRKLKLWIGCFLSWFLREGQKENQNPHWGVPLFLTHTYVCSMLGRVPASSFDPWSACVLPGTWAFPTIQGMEHQAGQRFPFGFVVRTFTTLLFGMFTLAFCPFPWPTKTQRSRVGRDPSCNSPSGFDFSVCGGLGPSGRLGSAWVRGWLLN